MTTIATPKAVFNAANELHASGQPVTAETVIAKIKGGSKSTVGPLLEAWHSMLKAKVEAMPSSLEARARELVAVIWHEARCMADASTVAARREFDTELRARDVVVEHTLEPIRVLEAEVQRLQSALQTEQVRSASLLARIQKSAEETNELDRHMAAAEQARAQCAEHERTTTRLQAENTVLREQFALFAPRRKGRSKAGTGPRNRPASTVRQ